MRSAAGAPERVRRGDRALDAPFGRRRQLGGALERPRRDGVAAAGARPLCHRRELGGDVLVRARDAGGAVPGAPVGLPVAGQARRERAVRAAPAAVPRRTGRSPSARAGAGTGSRPSAISIRPSSSAPSIAVAGMSEALGRGQHRRQVARVVGRRHEEQRADLLGRGLDAARVRALDEAGDRDRRIHGLLELAEPAPAP